jgi:hypothetical protein
LSAVLDWSYELLTAEERLALTRLSVFRGQITLQAATALLYPLLPVDGAGTSAVLDLVADLGAKSWLSSDASRDIVHYRWLELTHAYALTKLNESGEYGAIAVRHARYVFDPMSVAGDAWASMTLTDWTQEYRWALEDVRGALTWCFSSDGDLLLGISFTALVAPMAANFNAFDTPRDLHRALKALGSLPEAHADLEVRLTSALLFSDIEERSDASDPEREPRALIVAERSGDPKLLAEALIAVVLTTWPDGGHSNSLSHTERLSVAATQSADQGTIVVADRIHAQIQRYAGNHHTARIMAERVLRHPIPRASLRTRAAGLDHSVSMRMVLSRILWLEGFADQASDLAAEPQKLAWTQGTFARCQALSLALCPIAFWPGNMQLARELSPPWSIVRSD